MRFAFVAVVTLSRLLAGVSAQQTAQTWAGTDLLSFTGAISPCAVHCVVQALTSDGCNPNDFVCHCANTSRVDATLYPCLNNSTCSPTDLASSGIAVDSACAYFNGSSNGTISSASPTPTTLTGAAATAATIRNTATPTVIPSASAGGVPTATQQLLLSFSGTGQVSPGAVLGINVPSAAPQVGLSNVPLNNQRLEPGSAASIYNPANVQVFGPQLYFLAAVDPDAPDPANPIRAQIIHWLQPNMRLINGSTLAASAVDTIPFIFFANETSTPPLAPYRRPMPPTYSPAHRYIFYIFEQPVTFSVPAGFNASNRANFNISRFAADAGLGSPIAANYILVSNATGAVAPNATTVPGGGMLGGTATTTASGVAVYTGAAVSVVQSGWTVAALFASAVFAMGL